MGSHQAITVSLSSVLRYVLSPLMEFIDPAAALVEIAVLMSCTHPVPGTHVPLSFFKNTSRKAPVNDFSGKTRAPPEVNIIGSP